MNRYLYPEFYPHSKASKLVEDYLKIALKEFPKGNGRFDDTWRRAYKDKKMEAIYTGALVGGGRIVIKLNDIQYEAGQYANLKALNWNEIKPTTIVADTVIHDYTKFKVCVTLEVAHIAHARMSVSMKSESNKLVALAIEEVGMSYVENYDELEEAFTLSVLLNDFKCERYIDLKEEEERYNQMMLQVNYGNMPGYRRF